ncbi:MAG TPA: 23S rRNA (pseudouridine(1915)-N(3))-methyltransferase RlmH [Firmicutes bacterium]|nr:23S rRNA (pseudouridine(1915)-N(3))-methyltransferase RlmH [Bacillota bacterium]
MIKIICLGKIKEKYLVDLMDDYRKRISKYHKIEIIELKDEENLESEASNILKYIDLRDYVIACAIEGESLDSPSLAKRIDEIFIQSGTISFIIGSSQGLSQKIKTRANMLLSFSKLTMPHGLFRGVLLEQIYRSFKINNNENYHK